MTPLFTPYKNITPLTPKQASLFAKYVSLKLPNSIRLFTMREVKLLKAASFTTHCKFNKIRTLFHSSITYT
jgi:hypothetical protein